MDFKKLKGLKMVKVKDKMMTGEVVMMMKLACMGAREGEL
jgi:hypothetical protein